MLDALEWSGCEASQIVGQPVGGVMITGAHRMISGGDRTEFN
jgi:hypothetical protein